MLKRNKELEFTKNDLKQQKDGTVWFAEDLLDRGPHVRAITDLLLTTEGNFVMTLSSPWGTGKTTFMRMWKAYLESLGHPCVLFNAWENDYVDNPLLSFISEMGMQLNQMKKTTGEVNTKTFEKVWAFGKKLLPQTLSIGTRLLLGTAVDFSELIDSEDKKGKKIAEQLGGVLGGSVEGYAQELLSQQVSTKNTVKDFKKAVSRFIKAHTKKKKKPPLFFFVDELDRCKPTYAVELLEVIKHLFDIEGIVFVLSLDREQLGHSVRAAYGDGMDASGYLRRFIDLEYRIPEPAKEKFLEHLIDVYGVKEYPIFIDNNHCKALTDFRTQFLSIAKWHSLRTIEKTFLRGTILLKGLRSINHECFPAGTLAHFIFLRELSPLAFYEIIGGNTLSTIPNGQDLRKQLRGVDTERLSVWPKHKEVWKDPFKRRLNSVVGNDHLFREEAYFASLYFDENVKHLIDDIVCFLDLSEQLVPIEQE